MAKERIIIVIAALVALMAALLASINPERFLVASSAQSPDYIGVVKSVEGELKSQGANQVSWLSTKDGDPIYYKTKLYTQENGMAQYVFADGSKMEQKGATLIRLNKKIKGNALKGTSNNSLGLEVVDGEVELKVKDSRFFEDIKTPQAVIRLQDNTYVNIKQFEKETQLSVFQGKADVHREDNSDEAPIEVKKGEYLTASKMGVFNKSEIAKDTNDEESIAFNRVNNEEQAIQQQEEAEKIAKSSTNNGRKGSGGKAKGSSRFLTDEEKGLIERLRINDFKSFLYELGKIIFLQ